MATNATQQIVNKAWSFAHVLRDDGLSYMGYTEQITFLLFLKMADQQTRAPWKRPSIIPKGKKGERYDGPALWKRGQTPGHGSPGQGRLAHAAWLRG